MKDVRDLARKLQHNEPDTFGLLTCHGFVAESDKSDNSEPDPIVDSTLASKLPPEYSDSRSLRDLLLDPSPTASLSFRLNIAKSLANAVGHVHTFGFVHKNIHPGSVIGFDTIDGTKPPAVFLVGFENFRRDQGPTLRFGDNMFERNLYRHPSRQGTDHQEDYVMQHDIYSLGVCLLEIGFWSSFINDNPQERGAYASPILGLSELRGPQLITFLQTQGKEHLLSLAASRLPQFMEDRYADIVKTCLTCLDPENEDFGDQWEFEDEDGILVGARYIEKASVI
jgi:serine/threonine protein kinase